MQDQRGMVRPIMTGAVTGGLSAGAAATLGTLGTLGVAAGAVAALPAVATGAVVGGLVGLAMGMGKKG